MTDDLGMDSDQYSIALIVFFITVCLAKTDLPGRRAIQNECLQDSSIVRCLRGALESHFGTHQAFNLPTDDHVLVGRCNLLYGRNQDVWPACRSENLGWSPRGRLRTRYPADPVVVVQEGGTIEAFRSLHLGGCAFWSIRRHYCWSYHWVRFTHVYLLIFTDDT